MVSVAWCRTLTVAGLVLALTALAMPSTVLAQRSERGTVQRESLERLDRTRQVLERVEPERSEREDQDAPSEAERVAGDERQRILGRLQEAIRTTEAQDGLDSPDLIDPLQASASLYQQGGEHLLAVAALERARQVVRKNYGLYSIEEVPLLRQTVRSVEALGNVETAWNLEQELLALVGRHEGDLRIVEVLREIADKRMDVLARYTGGEFPPEIVLGCYYEPPEGSFAANLATTHGRSRDCRAGSKDAAQRRLLHEAQSHRVNAIFTLLENEAYSSDELRELELELLSGSYGYGDYWTGMWSLRRLLAYQVANSEPMLARITTLVRMADWESLFARGLDDYESTLDLYRQAHAQLEREGIAQASIDEIFSPQIPVVLPTFLPNPLASEQTSESTAYIDVAFEITKHGESGHVKILDTTTNAARAAQRELARLIRRSRFRPVVTDGEFADSTRVVMRYHVRD